MQPVKHDIWAEIDLAAIARNLAGLKTVLTPGTKIMAVVKANAYGHGLIEVARGVLEAGADALGVARISEAVQIRKNGISAPVLIFGDTSPEWAPHLAELNLTQTVWRLDTAARLSSAAGSRGKRIKVHLKVDTGMGRLGILPGDLARSEESEILVSDASVEEVICMSRLPGIDLEGIYTHFAAADDPDKSYSRRQFSWFTAFMDRLKAEGVEFPVRHAANSAAILDLPETHLDMVRAGIALYGYSPFPFVRGDRVGLTPAMTLKTRIIHIKKVEKGFCVSYGGRIRTCGPTRIATVSIGYGDGYRRGLSSGGGMLVNGRYAPLIGRICMDQTMIDIGDIPARPGDEVVVFGTQGGQRVSVEDIAEKLQTIPYEVITAISDRVPRVYAGDSDQ